MVNQQTGERELAYVVTIDEIKPIQGYDRVEYARTNGWWVVVRKGQFSVGDLAIYFEIDSKVPQMECFKFLASKHYKIKTQKMCKVISQGLLMHPDDFGWTCANGEIKTNEGDTYHLGDFVTTKLGVTYADADDQARKTQKSDPEAKYRAMSQRHSDLFKKKPIRWLMKRDWGKKILFVFFGKKKNNIPTHFPTKFAGVSKTDQERVENMPWILKNKNPWIKTLKIDGTSSTYILERKRWPHKNEFYVCSRNVRQLTPDQKCYHDDNVYWNMAYKYKIQETLQFILDMNPELKWVALQGETCGVGVQGNPHKVPDTRFYGFHYTDSKIGRWNPLNAKIKFEAFNIPWVPIVDDNYILPDTMEKFKASADGRCEIPDSCGLREGYVYYSTLNPEQSFKNVSAQYLLKH